MRALVAIALLALPAAGQERMPRLRIDMLVADAGPLKEAEVAAAVERAFSATRVAAKKFDLAAKDTYALDGDDDGWRVQIGMRVFIVRLGKEPVFDEDFARRQKAEIGRAIAAHKGFLEFRGGDFTLIKPRKVESILEYEEEKRRLDGLSRERDAAFLDGMCRLAAEFESRKPTAIYVADSNYLFVADEITLGWLKLPRPMSRLSSAIGTSVRWYGDDGRQREAATRKAQANWGRFVGSFGRKGGEGYRVLVDYQELDRSEPVWVVVKEIKADRIKGTLAKEPITLEAVKGQEVKVTRKEVLDWVFVEAGQTVGGFTLAAPASK